MTVWIHYRNPTITGISACRNFKKCRLSRDRELQLSPDKNRENVYFTFNQFDLLGASMPEDPRGMLGSFVDITSVMLLPMNIKLEYGEIVGENFTMTIMPSGNKTKVSIRGTDLKNMQEAFRQLLTGQLTARTHSFMGDQSIQTDTLN